MYLPAVIDIHMCVQTHILSEFIDQRIIRVDLSRLPLEDAFVNYFNYSSVAILFSCKLIHQPFHTVPYFYRGPPVK